MLLASSGQRPGMLLNILPCAGQPFPQRVVLRKVSTVSGSAQRLYKNVLEAAARLLLFLDTPSPPQPEVGRGAQLVTDQGCYPLWPEKILGWSSKSTGPGEMVRG